MFSATTGQCNQMLRHAGRLTKRLRRAESSSEWRCGLAGGSPACAGDRSTAAHQHFRQAGRTQKKPQLKLPPGTHLEGLSRAAGRQDLHTRDSVTHPPQGPACRPGLSRPRRGCSQSKLCRGWSSAWSPALPLHAVHLQRHGRGRLCVQALPDLGSRQVLALLACQGAGVGRKHHAAGSPRSGGSKKRGWRHPHACTWRCSRTQRVQSQSSLDTEAAAPASAIALRTRTLCGLWASSMPDCYVPARMYGLHAAGLAQGRRLT